MSTFSNLVFTLGFSIFSVAISAQQVPVVINITNEVALENTIRLGMNTGGDNYWDASLRKIRAEENFEGVMFRMMCWGPAMDANGIGLWFSPSENTRKFAKGRVKYTIIGGPSKGQSGLVQDFSKRKINSINPQSRDDREVVYMHFEKPVTPPESGNKHAVMLEFFDMEKGSIRESMNKAFWNSPHNTAVSGDVPPGSFGNSALLLAGSKERSHYTFIPMWDSQGVQSGIWHVNFWAKAKDPDAKLSVTCSGAENTGVELTPDWKYYELKINSKGDHEAGNGVVLRLVAEDGDVLVDDFLLWKDEEHRNPTAFRDSYVDLLKKLNPGILRKLQMGGSSIANNLQPRMRQVAYTSNLDNVVSGGRNNANYYDYNVHEFFELCEYIDTNPWYCLPGTVHPEELNIFMEFLSAPADEGWGLHRAILGREEPWTDAFEKIFIEMGNEAWNSGGSYAIGSFNGPDHWKDCFDVIKKSKYYDPDKFILISGSQHKNLGITVGVLRDVPNADAVSTAPYLMNGMQARDFPKVQNNARELFEWIFAYTIRRNIDGLVAAHAGKTKEVGQQLTIYEHSFHISHPEPRRGGMSYEDRNIIQVSLGAGLNVVNDALLMMRENEIRYQCQFNLYHKNYFDTRLWGFVPGIDRHDQRYRPHFFAEMMAKKAIMGNMMVTTHSENQPTFNASGVFEDTDKARGNARIVTSKDYPMLWSYAFAEGNKRSLIIFNLAVELEIPVQLNFDGIPVGSAESMLLTSESIYDNNEPELKEPQVHIVEAEVADFKSGYIFNCAPFSMNVITWENR